MASLTFSQAKTLLAPFISSQGPTDPVVASAINFVNERFVSGGEWRGNRFIHSFTPQAASDGSYFIDTVPGIESVIKVLAVSTDGMTGELGDIMPDWFPFDEGALGWLPWNYAGDLQLVRQGMATANPLPSQANSETQRYRILGQMPETRTMYCLVRRGYVPLVNDNDLLIPSNRNAYRYGVQAYNYENINELERAQVYWGLAYQCLNDETASMEEAELAEVQVQTKAFAPGAIQNLI